jgi:molecular chaperone GrpE
VSSGQDRVEQEVMPPTEAASPPSAGDDDAAPIIEGEAAIEGEVELEPDPEEQQRQLAAKYLDLAQRTQADFDNYRKRMAREVRAAEARGIAKLAKELLPALDNLERALQAVEQSDPDHHLTEGIRLVTSELSVALGRAGIQGYDPTGEQFDPNQHEAVAQQPFEGKQSGTVVQVLQSGYRLNDAILRPARVIVAS